MECSPGQPPGGHRFESFWDHKDSQYCIYIQCATGFAVNIVPWIVPKSLIFVGMGTIIEDIVV